MPPNSCAVVWMCTLAGSLALSCSTAWEVGWKNSQLLGPDVPAAVEKLRAQPGGEIRVWGSSQLIRTLAEHDLVDEYRLMLHPVVLGRGRRLFKDGAAPTDLALVETRKAGPDVQLLIYRPANLSE